MPSLVEKSSSVISGLAAGSVPDFPHFSPVFAALPGALETDASIARWNDLMKKRWVLQDESLHKKFTLKSAFTSAITSVNAAITHEEEVRTSEDEALASTIDTLRADFETAVIDLTAQITFEASARATADAALSVTIATVSASLGSLTATVSTISSALATAQGYLESRWTVQVSAGPVVTGITLFSASGPDTDVSYMAIQADRFQINTSAGNKQVFSTSAGAVKLGNVLTVDLTSAKVYIGSGSYATAGTAFYVDSLGRMSLDDKFIWTGSVLAITNGASSGNMVLIDSSGLRIGSTTATGTVHINDNGGLPYINLRYGGSVYGTWVVQSGYSSMLLSSTSPAGVITIDPRSGITLIGASLSIFTPDLQLTGAFTLDSSSVLTWGGDTNLYRSGSNTLRTDDTLSVGGGLSVGGSLSVSGSFSPGSISTGSLNGSSGGVSGSWAVGGGSGNPLYAASGRLYFAASGNRWFVSDGSGYLVSVANYGLKKESSDGWTNPLHDGSAVIEFQAVGAQIYGRINGGAGVLLG